MLCISRSCFCFFFFFFNDAATTEIYTLSLHDALPICVAGALVALGLGRRHAGLLAAEAGASEPAPRSEEHTSELQSRPQLVCRLLPEKKNQYCASEQEFRTGLRGGRR